jgi:hypothetical protein
MFIPLTKQQYENAIKTGFTPQQIVEMEKKRKAINTPEQKEPNYFERVWSEYEKAGQDIVSGIQKGAEQGQQGLKQGGAKGALNVVGGIARGGLRTVGAIAGSAFAPITEAPIIKPALGAIGTGISKIPGVSNVIQKGTELASKYPEIAKDVKNIVDISILGTGKPVGAGIEKTGIAVEKAGTEAINIAKNKFAAELIKPIETKATKLSQVARTTEAGGIFKKDIVTPTIMEENMAKEVAQIPGISPKNTFQKNFNLIRDYNVQQAKQLEADIAKYDFAIPKKEVISRLNVAANELKNSPLIVGDSAKTAQRLIAGAKNIIDKNSGTGSGLLKARKEYDSWVLSQKPKVFDATADNAFTIANDTVRKTLNNLLDEKAVNLGIKDSLKKQSTLYSAMENVVPKAAEEANTVFGRTMQKIGKILGTKNKIVQGIAAAVGIGGLGAAATFATPAVVVGGTGYLIYSAGKLIMKPEIKILLGKLLRESGGILDATDRAAIQKLLTDYSSED